MSDLSEFRMFHNVERNTLDTPCQCLKTEDIVFLKTREKPSENKGDKMNKKRITLDEMEIRSIMLGLTLSILETLDLPNDEFPWSKKETEINYLRGIRTKLENA